MGGISGHGTEDVNELERQFLSAIDWQLYVNEEEFYQVLQRVERRIAMTEGIERGWFSYTDLWVISICNKFFTIGEPCSRTPTGRLPHFTEV